MGARFYDEAIVNKIQKWIPQDSPLRILKPNEVSRLLKMKADESNDKITLPFISLSRSGYKILNTKKQPKSFDGVTIRVYDKEGNLVNKGSAMKLNAIPIQLEYYLDIYCIDMDECDEYSRNFIFNFVNYPVSYVEIPYNNVKATHKFTINVEQDVEDNSDVPERLFPDQFSRYTLKLIIDDAYLFSVPSKLNVAIEGVQLATEDDSIHKIVEIQEYDFEKESK